MSNLQGYLTAEEAARSLGWGTAPNENVLQTLSDALVAIEDMIDQYCNTHIFEAATTGTTKTFIGTGANIISLDGYFIRNLTSVEIIPPGGIAWFSPDCLLKPDNPRRKDGSDNLLYSYIVRQLGYGIGMTLPAVPMYWQDTRNFPKDHTLIVTADWGCESEPTAIKTATKLALKQYLNLTGVSGYNEMIKMESSLGRMVEFNDSATISFFPKIVKTILEPWRYRGVSEGS